MSGQVTFSLSGANSDEALVKFAKDFREHGQATITFLRSYTILQLESMPKGMVDDEWRHFKANFLGRAMLVLPLGDTVIRTTEMEKEEHGIHTKTLTVYALSPENWDLIRDYKAYSSGR